MRFLILVLTLCSLNALAEDLPVKFGGFVDSYYAFDANNPKNHEREFTTQPVRHNEFNVNLAYIEAVIKQEKLRGRLALQYGNSVYKNTTGEPNQGATSGPDDAKVFQEAYVGKKLGDKTWIDVGIFFGNIGAESFISKDNWTYSRSLNADYVPYYSSGVRIEHNLNERQSFQIQLLNGWQNISENNHGKAIGMQYKHVLDSAKTFTYNNFLGDEEVVPNQTDKTFRPRFRSYHNFIFQWLFSDKWQYRGSFDIGHQSQQENKGVDGWIVTSHTIKRVISLEQSIAARVEYYADPHQTNASTGTPNGFQVYGASVNFDQKLDHNALWRTEIRGFSSKDKIYPQGTDKKKNLMDF